MTEVARVWRVKPMAPSLMEDWAKECWENHEPKILRLFSAGYLRFLPNHVGSVALSGPCMFGFSG